MDMTLSYAGSAGSSFQVPIAGSLGRAGEVGRYVEFPLMLDWTSGQVDKLHNNGDNKTRLCSVP